jgi:hypothetical protein
MTSFTENKLANQRVDHQTKRQRAETSRRELKVLQFDSTPSWKRYGKGVGMLDVSAAISREDNIAHISFHIAETHLADSIGGPKRDVTKETYFTAYGPAAFEIYEMLREVFEPVEAKPDAVGGKVA